MTVGDGFEPSAFYSSSSVSAAFRASVAANLHPYAAPFCTPLATRIPQPGIIPELDDISYQESGEANRVLSAEVRNQGSYCDLFAYSRLTGYR